MVSAERGTPGSSPKNIYAKRATENPSIGGSLVDAQTSRLRCGQTF